MDTNALNGQTNYYELAAADACGTGTMTTASGVLLPLPVLGVTMSANAMSLAWPGWADDWGVYAATNLAPPVVWTQLTNPALSNNGSFHLTLPLGSGNQFFRLASP